jgi:type IV pilus assembly protein PilE
MKAARSVQGVRARRQAGLTLIELMVAMAVSAILLSVAYPSYLEQVRKGRRADAQAVLLEAAQFMERYATENMRYDRNPAGTDIALPASLAKAPKEGASKYYDISLQAVAQNSYTLRAVPVGGASTDRCGTLTLSHTGARTAAQADCWRR